MASYTTDTTITSNLANDESLTITGIGVTVTIDASVFIPTMQYGQFNATNFGTFKLINKTNNILPITFASNSRDFRFEKKGSLIIDGDLIEIATGDGTAGQTIDFNSIGDNNASIDMPNAVWIEETPGGVTKPFISLGDASVDPKQLTFTGDGIGNANYGGIAGDWERGGFFEYDRATHTATFGDGTNGHVIPNGCKVFFPNVVVDSQWVNTYNTRSTFDTNINGALNFYGVQFSEAFYFNTSSSLDITLEYCSNSDYLRIQDSFGIVSVKNHAHRHPTRGSLTSGSARGSALFRIEDCQVNDNVIENLYAMLWVNAVTTSSSAKYGVGLFPRTSTMSFKNLHFYLLDKRNTSQNAVHYSALIVAEDTTIENVYTIGGATHYSTCNNVTIKNTFFGGTIFEPVANAIHGQKYRNIGITYAGSNCKIINWSLLPNSLPPITAVKLPSASGKNMEIYNVNYTYTAGYSNGQDSFIDVNSDDIVAKNCYGNSPSHDRTFESGLDAINAEIDNVISVGNDSFRKNTTANMVGGKYNSSNFSVGNGIGVFLAVDLTTSGSNDGFIGIPSGPPITDEYHFSLGANSYFDNSTRVWIYGNEPYEIGGKQPMRGFTGFRDSNYYELGSLEFNEIDAYVEMVNGDEEFTGTWTEFDTSTNNWYTGLQSIFNGLTGYDSNVGLNIRFKFVKNTLLTAWTDLLVYNIPCTIDTNYTADDGSITFEGGDATEKYEIIKASDDSVLYTFIGTGTYNLFIGSNLDVEVYFKRYKYVNSAYVLLVNTQYTTQKLVLGNNGNILLYTGNEVQIASTDPATIWNYTTRTTTEGFTSSDRSTLNKGLTTGKFLALK